MKEQTDYKVFVAPIKDMVENTGQIEGLPKNPRYIRSKKFQQLVAGMKKYPKQIKINPVKVVRHGDQLVVVNGNHRLKAAREAGWKELPMVDISDWSIEEIKHEVITDNLTFAEWDFTELLEGGGWQTDELGDWGFDELIKKDEDLKAEQLDKKYTNENCVYPLIPVYDEKYNAFVIICKTETEEAAIRTRFGFPNKAQSYKNKFLGKSYVLTADEILNPKTDKKE